MEERLHLVRSDRQPNSGKTDDKAAHNEDGAALPSA
jgi:hypothetical protein